MKQVFKNFVSSLLLVGVLAGVGVVASSQPAYALDCAGADKEAAACKVQSGVNQVGGTENSATDLNAFIKKIINTLLFVIGAVAVIMIIIGGIRYVTSNGEQAHVKGAKDTILYAVVGLVVAILAYAIVNFVVMNVK